MSIARTFINNVITVSGDMAGNLDPGTGSIPITLSSTGITAATYGDSTHSVTVQFDAKGRAVTASSTPISASGIGAMLAANNLSELVSPSAAALNLSLGASSNVQHGKLNVGSNDFTTADLGTWIDSAVYNTNLATPSFRILDNRTMSVDQSMSAGAGDQIALMRLAPGVALTNSSSVNYAAITISGFVGDPNFNPGSPDPTKYARGNIVALTSHLDLVGNDITSVLRGSYWHLGSIGNNGTTIAYGVSAQNAFGTWQKVIGYQFDGVDLGGATPNATWAWSSDGSTQSSHGGHMFIGGGGPQQVPANSSVAATIGAATKSSTGNTTNGSPTITSVSPALAQSDVGKTISGTGIPASSYIISVTNFGQTITIGDATYAINPNNKATATNTGVTLTVGVNRSLRLHTMTDAQYASMTLVDGMMAYIETTTAFLPTGLWLYDQGQSRKVVTAGDDAKFAATGSIQDLPTLSIGTISGDNLASTPVSKRVRIRDSGTYTDSVDWSTGHYGMNSTMNPGASVNVYGLDITGTPNVTASGTNLSTLTGLNVAPIPGGSGRIGTSFTAIQATATIGALTGATTPTVYGLRALAGLAFLESGGSITTAIAGYFLIENLATSGTIGTSIGVKIDAPTTAGQSLGTQWGLQQIGSTPVNKFEGALAIGTSSAPATTALLDLVSTTQGLLLPRMTTTQRDAISSPPSGLMIYNSTTGKINIRGASAWEAVTSA